MRTYHSRIASPPQGVPEFRQVIRRHAMNSGVVTDIRKEASIARSGSTDDETKPTFGAQFAPHGRRSPVQAAPWCSRVRPGVGPPPRRDLRVAFVSPRRNEPAPGLRGIWRAGRFHGNSRRVWPTQWRDASMDSSNLESGWLEWTLAARCDCNLHSSRAQFVEGANRVFDRQIDAS
jgi:hypothetical protein